MSEHHHASSDTTLLNITKAAETSCLGNINVVARVMDEKDCYLPWFVATVATCLKTVGGSVHVFVSDCGAEGIKSQVHACKVCVC